MNHKYAPWLILAALLVLIGLYWGGVSVTPVVYPLILLACPLMMFWMMRGMNGGHRGKQLRRPQQPSQRLRQ